MAAQKLSENFFSNAVQDSETFSALVVEPGLRFFTRYLMIIVEPTKLDYAFQVCSVFETYCDNIITEFLIAASRQVNS